MLNPMSRGYPGYTQANQSLAEEDENAETETEDLEAGTRADPNNTFLQSASKSQTKRKVAWDAGASEMNVLRPNIHQNDRIHEHDSSDDEVPQSFMVEASSKQSPSRSSKGKERSTRKQLAQPSSGKASARPTLPTVVSFPSADAVSPQPSQQGTGNGERPSSPERQPKPMRGLDAYERALWNWVNVYNLDAFLQEVYYYYEGKGIYSIALARGLNLLLVNRSVSTAVHLCS
jgi:autophagy-related protein 9